MKRQHRAESKAAQRTPTDIDPFQNAEGGAFYWEYSIAVDPSLVVAGLNTVQVLIEDHGGGTYFDMRLAGDVVPVAVPAPATLALMGLGLIGFSRLRRRS